MDIRKTTHHSYTGISMCPGFCTKERETDHTEVHKYPIIRGYAKKWKSKADTLSSMNRSKIEHQTESQLEC